MSHVINVYNLCKTCPILGDASFVTSSKTINNESCRNVHKIDNLKVNIIKCPAILGYPCSPKNAVVFGNSAKN